MIWTGLLRGVEAKEFKPNSFFFCSAMGFMAIAAGYCLQINKTKVGIILGIVPVGIVLAFYVNCFITEPTKDANIRVALVIIAALAELVVLTFPKSHVEKEDA